MIWKDERLKEQNIINQDWNQSEVPTEKNGQKNEFAWTQVENKGRILKLKQGN